jgi:hypothetical protein
MLGKGRDFCFRSGVAQVAAARADEDRQGPVGPGRAARDRRQDRRWLAPRCLSGRGSPRSGRAGHRGPGQRADARAGGRAYLAASRPSPAAARAAASDLGIRGEGAAVGPFSAPPESARAAPGPFLAQPPPRARARPDSAGRRRFGSRGGAASGVGPPGARRRGRSPCPGSFARFRPGSPRSRWLRHTVRPDVVAVAGARQLASERPPPGRSRR